MGFLQRFMGYIQRLWSGDFNEGALPLRAGHSGLSAGFFG